MASFFNSAFRRPASMTDPLTWLHNSRNSSDEPPLTPESHRITVLRCAGARLPGPSVSDTPSQHDYLRPVKFMAQSTQGLTYITTYTVLSVHR